MANSWRLDYAYSSEGYWEAESFRLKGELLFIENDIAGAEAYLKRAIEIARNQKAKSLELRAVISLAHMWDQREKNKQAHQMLNEIYNWFTEGFDTPDLLAAKVLIEELKM